MNVTLVDGIVFLQVYQWAILSYNAFNALYFDGLLQQ